MLYNISPLLVFPFLCIIVPGTLVFVNGKAIIDPHYSSELWRGQLNAHDKN